MDTPLPALYCSRISRINVLIQLKPTGFAYTISSSSFHWASFQFRTNFLTYFLNPLTSCLHSAALVVQKICSNNNMLIMITSHIISIIKKSDCNHCLVLSHLCCGRSVPHLWGQEFRLQEACVGGAHTLPLQTWPCSLGNGEYVSHSTLSD